MRKLLAFSCMAAMLCSFNGVAWGGGMGLYEMGTPDLGSAAAGRAALAQDASTAFGNPAGMSQLKDSQIMLGSQTLIITEKFSAGSGSTYQSDGDGGNAGGVMPVGSLFAVQKINDRFDVGVSLASYSGLSLQYADNWAGKYWAQESSLLTMNLNPVASYKFSDKLSVGAGFSTMLGMLDARSAVNRDPLGTDPHAGTGTIEMKSTAVGFGGNAGVMFVPLEGTRLGATYRSQVDLPFNDVLSVSDLGPALSALQNRLQGTTVDATVTIPQEVMLSGYQKLTEKVALLANVGWQDWSQFGQINVTIDRESQTEGTVDANYQDTWHGALGAQVKLKDSLLWSLGTAYDTSAVKSSDRGPAVPFDTAWRYATGIQWMAAPNITLGAAYELINGGSAGINQAGGPMRGSIQGNYNSWVNVIGMNINVKY